MPARQRQTLRHVFGGGWATDLGQESGAAPDANGTVTVPFLLDSLNQTYELDGGPRKIGGTSVAHTGLIPDADGIVKGLFDYWKQGAGGSPVQKIVCHAATGCYAGSLDGAMTELSNGAAGTLVSGSVISYETFDDLLIIASDGDVPKSWDQTTFQTLAGSPENFSFCEMHKGRLWAAGDPAVPYRLYYSVLHDPEDWGGAGSGHIDIDPNDGDGITALASHKDNLWVFKGPYKGSIHRIVGSAPTGSDSFGRITFVRGIGAVGHNTLFRFKDDLGFMWSDGSIHSLAATASYGDFSEASLSRPINNWLRAYVNGSRMKHAWAIDYSSQGFALFAIPISTSTNNNHHLMMDYRFNPVRWAHWDAYDSASLAMVIDSGIPTPFDGSNRGTVRRLQQGTRSVDATDAIPSTTTTPFMHYNKPQMMKQLDRASVGLAPKGTYDFIFGWTQDDHNEKTVSKAQGAGGAILPFKLGVDPDAILGGSTYSERFMPLDEEGGEFRAVSYRISSNLINEDIEISSFSATIGFGAESGEN